MGCILLLDPSSGWVDGCAPVSHATGGLRAVTHRRCHEMKENSEGTDTVYWRVYGSIQAIGLKRHGAK